MKYWQLVVFIVLFKTTVFSQTGSGTIVIRKNISNDSIQIESSKSIKPQNTSFLSERIYNLTPNGDNKDDFFMFVYTNIVSLDAKIFDKKDGTIVYQWTDINGRWIGKDLKGKKAKNGTYYFTMRATKINGKVIDTNGYINLIQ